MRIPFPRFDAPPGVAWVALGAVLLMVGVFAFVASPRLGVVALGIPMAPLLVVAPAHAFLVFLAALPFDAVASIVASQALTLTRLLAMAVLGGWVVHVLVRRERVQLGTPGLLLLAYVAFALLSVTWADNAEATWRALRTLAQLFLLYVMAANLLRRPAILERALDVLIVATVVLSLLVLWQFPSSGDIERATFTYGAQHFNSNYLAASLVFPAIAALALGRAAGPLGWWRPLCVVPIGVAMLAAGSRGGFLALLMGLAVLAATRPRLGFRLGGAGLLVVLLAVLVLPAATVEHFVDRLAGAGSDRLSGRLDIWKVGLAMIVDRPLQGTGFACFRDAFYRYMATAGLDPQWALQHHWGGRVAHNVYVGTVAELGVVGAGVLFAALASHGLAVWRSLREATRAADPRLMRLSLALLGVLGSFLVFGNSIDLMTTKQAWVVLGAMQGLALASDSLANERYRT